MATYNESKSAQTGAMLSDQAIDEIGRCRPRAMGAIGGRRTEVGGLRFATANPSIGGSEVGGRNG